MARKYPHLTPRSGEFPYLDDVNVFKWKNDFDYTRWGEQSKITLCNVPFDVEYENIVDWQTVDNRDAQLNALQHYTSEPLGSNFRIDKNQRIKLPIPFDIADGANYLIVRNRLAATRGNIDYEKEGGISDLFFFILDCEQKAPNTTEFTLKLDIWTTYFQRISLQAGMVERGHAAVAAAATPEEFLENPLANTAHLTAPDVSVNSEGDLVSYQQPILMDDQDHFIAWAWQYDIKTLSEITATSKVRQEITPLTYSGQYSENVAGWDWNLGADSLKQGYGWRTARDSFNRPPQMLGRNSHEQPGAFIFGVQAAQAQQFFEDLEAYYPHLSQNISAAFLLPAQIVNQVLTFDIAGHTIVMLQPRRITAGINLEKQQFAYDEKYANLTKLYTSPYAKIALTDVLGNEVEINVQDCTSSFDIQLAATVLSGCTLRAEFVGVGGASANYQWNVISTGAKEQEQMLGKAGTYFLEKNLPVYALAMSAATRHDLQMAKTLPVKRQQAITNYSNGQRAAGTAYETALAAARAAAANARRSAATDRDNSTRSASTSQVNANASAQANYSIAEVAAQAGRANDLANIAASRSLSDLQTANETEMQDIEFYFLDRNNDIQREKATFQFNINRQVRSANLEQSEEYQAQSLQLEQSSQAAKAGVNAVAGVGKAIVGGAMTGGAAGAVAGAIGGIFDAGVSVANLAIDQNNASAQTTLSIWNQAEMAEIETEQDRAKVNNASGSHGIGGLATDMSMNMEITRQNALTKSASSKKVQASQRLRAAGVNITSGTAESISARNLSTTLANAALSRDTAVGNTAREKSTADTNISAAYTTLASNTSETLATTEANNAQQLATTTTNAQASLPLVAAEARAEYEAASMAPDIAITQSSGNGIIYEMRRDGFSYQVRTPNDDAIAQLGDFFLRYGYAANRAYDMTQLALMKHFTYWKASDLFFKQTANAHIMEKVKQIFAQGVTVWRQMDDIGKFCIYDNEKEQ